MESSKSLTTKPAAEVALSTTVEDWGTDVFLGGQDIIIAKILPMQGPSELVTDGKAVIGEFRDSLSSEKLGSIADPIHIVPFHVEKVWDILEEDGDQFKWVRSEPLIEDPVKPGYNDNLPWNDKENGIDIKRVRRMNFYVMIVSQLEGGTAMPYVLSFKSTSYREGKKLFTQMYMRNRRSNLPPPAYTFKLSGTKEKNDKGTFIVLKIDLDRRSTNEEMKECLSWFQLIRKGSVKVDTSEDGVSAAEVVPDAPSSEGRF